MPASQADMNGRRSEGRRPFTLKELIGTMLAAAKIS